MPDETKDLMNWFEENYVIGRVRHQFRNGSVNRSNPIFPPKLSSIYLNNFICTMFLYILYFCFIYIPCFSIRSCNSTNSKPNWGLAQPMEILVRGNQVGVHHLISELQKEQKNVSNKVEAILWGEPRPNSKKRDEDRKQRIRLVINDRSNRSVLEFLRGIAHNLSI
jgi:hypothetical protein